MPYELPAPAWPRLFNHVADGGIKRECAAREAAGSGAYDALAHFYLFAAQRIVAIRHAGCLHRIGDQDQPLWRSCNTAAWRQDEHDGHRR